MLPCLSVPNFLLTPEFRKLVSGDSTVNQKFQTSPEHELIFYSYDISRPEVGLEGCPREI